MKIAIALACFVLVGFAQGAIPTESTCLSAFESAGFAALQTSLTPCAFSASSGCCDNIANLVGLDAESEFAGCLCNQGVIDMMVDEIESNALAQSIGFDGDRLMDVLTTCNAPFAGTPSCASTSAPSPPAVVVDVETTGVSVSVGTATVQESTAESDTSELIEEPVIVESSPVTMTNEDEETTFEDAREKIVVIKENLAMTQDTVTDSMLDGTEKVMDMKAGPPSSIDDEMIVEPKKTAPEMIVEPKKTAPETY